uniref:Uncharacterized protein n=1 Tax=Plectus sambesii TaxID=2011161 RepID=A0A914W187_9BILA
MTAKQEFVPLMTCSSNNDDQQAPTVAETMKAPGNSPAITEHHNKAEAEFIIETFKSFVCNKYEALSNLELPE